jgi:hypothetical protein
VEGVSVVRIGVESCIGRYFVLPIGEDAQVASVEVIVARHVDD